jgi:hypothetical protein
MTLLSSSSVDVHLRQHIISRGIDRSKPSILNHYTQDIEWEAFCDDIETDIAMESVSNLFKCFYFFLGMTIASIVLVFVLENWVCCCGCLLPTDEPFFLRWSFT